jgi:hypothetical protein
MLWAMGRQHSPSVLGVDRGVQVRVRERFIRSTPEIGFGLGTVEAWASPLSAHEQDRILGATAVEAYGL